MNTQNPTHRAIIRLINDYLQKEESLTKEFGPSYTIGYSIGVMKSIRDLLEDLD
jgi:hypothetical protein